VFAVLGIFSAAYRKLAAEAFDCVFRRIIFRPCHSGLDKRLKSEITGKIMRRSPRLAAFTYKYFEVFSWTFIILTVLSLVGIGISVYNYVEYGNCNGYDSNGVCIYKEIADATGTFKADTKCQNPSCQNPSCTCANITDCIHKNITSQCNATCIVGTTTES